MEHKNNGVAYPIREDGRWMIKTPAAQMDATRVDPKQLAKLIEYRLVEFMGACGFSDKAITNTLGLTKWQIRWRLHRASIKRTDYRNGTSPLAKQVINRLDTAAQRRLVNDLKPLLLK